MYGPAEKVKTAAYQDKVKDAKKTAKAKRDKTALKNTKCFNCGKKGHISADCTKPAKTTQETKTDSDTKSAISVGTSQVDKVKEVIAKAGKPTDPKDGDKIELTLDGQVCAQWCSKCSRYTWGP